MVLERLAPGPEVKTSWPSSAPASPGRHEFIVYCANQEETLGSTQNGQQCPESAFEGTVATGQTGLLVDRKRSVTDHTWVSRG